jgi:uncharacterized protein (UPF0305 family)
MEKLLEILKLYWIWIITWSLFLALIIVLIIIARIIYKKMSLANFLKENSGNVQTSIKKDYIEKRISEMKDKLKITERITAKKVIGKEESEEDEKESEDKNSKENDEYEKSKEYSKKPQENFNPEKGVPLQQAITDVPVEPKEDFTQGKKEKKSKPKKKKRKR